MQVASGLQLKHFFWVVVILCVMLSKPLIAQEPVTIEDPNLEAAIREAVNKPDGALTAEDMAQITVLSARRRDI